MTDTMESRRSITFSIGSTVVRDFGFLGPVHGTVTHWDNDKLVYSVQYQHTTLEHTEEEMRAECKLANGEGNYEEDHCDTVNYQRQIRPSSFSQEQEMKKNGDTIIPNSLESKDRDTNALDCKISTAMDASDKEVSPLLSQEPIPTAETLFFETKSNPEPSLVEIDALAAATTITANDATTAAGSTVKTTTSKKVLDFSNRGNDKDDNQSLASSSTEVPKNNEEAASVDTPKTILLSECSGLYKIGTLVRKKWKGLGVFYGIIMKVSKSTIAEKLGRNEFCVQYEDDEMEDYSQEELAKIVVARDTLPKNFLSLGNEVDRNKPKSKPFHVLMSNDHDDEQDHEDEAASSKYIVLDGADHSARLEKLKAISSYLKRDSAKTKESSKAKEDDDEFLAVKKRTYPNGTLVRKKFPNNTWYTGTVIDYDNETRYYRVRYEDDDEEEYFEHELFDILQLRKEEEVDVDDNSYIEDVDNELDDADEVDEDYNSEDDGAFIPTYSAYKKSPGSNSKSLKKKNKRDENMKRHERVKGNKKTDKVENKKKYKSGKDKNKKEATEPENDLHDKVENKAKVKGTIGKSTKDVSTLNSDKKKKDNKGIIKQKNKVGDIPRSKNKNVSPSDGMKRESMTPSSGSKKRKSTDNNELSGDKVKKRVIIPPKFPKGTVIEKEFPGFGIFKGTLVKYDSKEGLYGVQYEDGDSEEMNEKEVSMYAVTSNHESATVKATIGARGRRQTNPIVNSTTKTSDGKKGKISSTKSPSSTQQKYVNGTEVLMKSKLRGQLAGDIVNFDSVTGLYTVMFEDGDCEEFTEFEIGKIIVLSNDLSSQQRASTKRKSDALSTSTSPILSSKKKKINDNRKVSKTSQTSVAFKTNNSSTNDSTNTFKTTNSSNKVKNSQSNDKDIADSSGEVVSTSINDDKVKSSNTKVNVKMRTNKEKVKSSSNNADVKSSNSGSTNTLTNASTQIYPNGTKVEKLFPGFGIFKGEIVSYDESKLLYTVLYQDGDSEELFNAELSTIVKQAAPKYANGTRVEKEFEGHGTFYGKVVDYIKETNLYRILYDDGDAEDLAEDEVSRIAKQFPEATSDTSSLKTKTSLSNDSMKSEPTNKSNSPKTPTKAKSMKGRHSSEPKRSLTERSPRRVKSKDESHKMTSAQLVQSNNQSPASKLNVKETPKSSKDSIRQSARSPKKSQVKAR